MLCVLRRLIAATLSTSKHDPRPTFDLYMATLRSTLGILPI